MAKLPWQSVRLATLAVTLGGALLVLGKAIATPKSDPNAAQVQTLTQSVPLANWQLSESTALKPSKEIPTGQRYQYRQGSTVMEVEMRPMSGDGNISRLLFVHTPIRQGNANLQIRRLPNVGSHGVLSHEGRAYLSACVNPRGESTATEQDFTQNHYRHDLQVSRIVPWLLGQQPLLDHRCFWTVMSVPLPAGTNAEASEAAYKTLESAWSDWNRWWQDNFPPA